MESRILGQYLENFFLFLFSCADDVTLVSYKSVSQWGKGWLIEKFTSKKPLFLNIRSVDWSMLFDLRVSWGSLDLLENSFEFLKDHILVHCYPGCWDHGCRSMHSLLTAGGAYPSLHLPPPHPWQKYLNYKMAKIFKLQNIKRCKYFFAWNILNLIRTYQDIWFVVGNLMNW